MLNDSPNQVIRELWQCQPVEGIKMSAEEIRRRAAKFERKIRWRNLREYLGGAIAAGFFVWFFVTTHDVLFRVSYAVLIAGLAYMAYQLHRRASAGTMPGDLGVVNSLEFHRRELERQLDFSRHIWRWYLGPLVPGLVLFSVATLLADPHKVLRQVLVNLVFALSLILAWRLTVYAARCLEKRIDELNAAEPSAE